MSDRRTTLRAEDAVDGVARRALASPALDGALDGQFVLGEDSDQGYLSQLFSFFFFHLQSID